MDNEIFLCSGISAGTESVSVLKRYSHGFEGKILTGENEGIMTFVSNDNIITKHWTLLSFGGGQDSTAILLKLIHDPAFRGRYAPGELVVVMSDTGNEHNYTYEHVKEMESLCAYHDILFYLLTPDMGFHTDSWPDLITPQMRPEDGELKPTMVQLGTKSCTDNLKLVPIYKMIDEFLNDDLNYGFKRHKNRGVLKKAIKKFHKDHGKLNVLIGFAYGEEKRAIKSDKLQEKHWNHDGDIWQKALSRQYPLIDLEMDRHKCQEYIEEKLGYCPMPSNCMLCPYQADQEILWLHRNHPEQFDKWIDIESRKFKRYEGIEKNHGVYNSKKTLLDKLKKAQDKHGHLSNEELETYKMSHGCSTNSI